MAKSSDDSRRLRGHVESDRVGVIIDELSRWRDVICAAERGSIAANFAGDDVAIVLTLHLKPQPESVALLNRAA